jgi:hypothetical protein
MPKITINEYFYLGYKFKYNICIQKIYLKISQWNDFNFIFLVIFFLLLIKNLKALY